MDSLHLAKLLDLTFSVMKEKMIRKGWLLHNKSLLYALPAGAFHNILLLRDRDSAVEASRMSTLQISRRETKA